MKNLIMVAGLTGLLGSVFSAAVLAHTSVVVVPIGGDTYIAAVPKTGQSLCYALPALPPPGGPTPDPIPCAGTGQDGETQTGIAPPAIRFTDNADGTILDNFTGLIWLKDANCRDTIDVSSDGRVLYIKALEFLGQLNSGTISGNCGDTNGHDDWRIPNRYELVSLLDIGEVGPALPSGHPFTNTDPDFYWTSSYDSFFGPGLGIGWNVHFSAGSVSGRSRVLDTANIWPVRGGL